MDIQMAYDQYFNQIVIFGIVSILVFIVSSMTIILLIVDNLRLRHKLKKGKDN